MSYDHCNFSHSAFSSLSFLPDCLLAAQQHHGPGAVLRHLLQVSFSFPDCLIYCIYTVSLLQSCRLLLTGLCCSAVQIPEATLHNWATTRTH